MIWSLWGRAKIFFGYLFRALTPSEKIILTLALVIALASIPLGIKARLALEREIPLAGGIFSEGVLVKAVDAIDMSSLRLTHRGLIGFDQSGAMQPDLAETVEFDRDRRRFVIRFSESAALEAIRTAMVAEDLYKEATVVVTDPRTILVEFPQSKREFLDELATPHLSFGPYVLVEGDGTQRVFERNTQFSPPAHLDKIILTPFESEEKLTSALKRKTVIGEWGLSEAPEGDGLREYDVPSALSVVVFYNSAQPGQKTAQERSSLRDGAVKDRTLRVLATDSKDVEQVLTEWSAQLSASKSRLEITTTSRADVANAFSRDQQYDAVALMADLTSDRAQRAFWHSSQLAPLGQNYAKWFNPGLDDAIEALERSSSNEERLRLREKIKEILSKDVPAGIYPVPPVPYVISDKLKGVEFSPIHAQSDRFKSIEGWYLKGKRVQ